MQKQTSRGVLRKRSSENMHQSYRRTPLPKRNFNKVALLCCKFATYFQDNFSKEHLWTTAPDYVKAGIWSKSVIKKLQFNEKNNWLISWMLSYNNFHCSLEVCWKQWNELIPNVLTATSSIILQVFRMSSDSQHHPIFMKFSNFLLYGGVS